MEFHEALEKASPTVEAYCLVTNGKGDMDVVPMSQMTNSAPPDYATSIKPLISKWSDIVGDKILDVTRQLGRLGKIDQTDEDDDRAQEAFEATFKAVGVDIACGVFSIGYLLGDPEWDRKPHNDETFTKALIANADTHKLLVNRFSSLDLVREQFIRSIALSATYVSNVFSQQEMDHNAATVHLWGKLASSMVFYSAFITGLKTRRVLEEDSVMDSFKRDLES